MLKKEKTGVNAKKPYSEIFYNCMSEGVVSRENCEKCWNNNEVLRIEYKRRANCVKNNAEKEPTEF